MRATASGAGRDASEQGVLGAAQRRAEDPLHARPRGWLDADAPAPREQLVSHGVGVTLALADVLGEPLCQLLGVAHGKFAQTELPADLGAVRLDLTPVKVILRDLAVGHADLPRDRADRVLGQLTAARGEPSPPMDELQEHAEPEPCRARLVAKQPELGGREREMVDRLLQLQQRRHRHPLPRVPYGLGKRRPSQRTRRAVLLDQGDEVRDPCPTRRPPQTKR